MAKLSLQTLQFPSLEEKTYKKAFSIITKESRGFRDKNVKKDEERKLRFEE